MSFFVGSDPTPAQPVDERVAADTRGVQRKRAADEGNPAMTESDDVIDGLADAVRIIHRDVAHPRPYLTDVHEDERDPAAGELLDQTLVHLRRHERHTIDLALEHPAQAGRHPVRLVIRAREDQIVLMLLRQ